DTNIGLLLSNIRELLSILKKNLRNHYRKNQMVLFPYLERRGIISVPRILRGKEDQVMVRLRELSTLIEKGLSNPDEYTKNIAEKVKELSKEISDLVFREGKILFPSVWALFSEGEWAAIHGIAKEVGYLVPVDVEWVSSAKPILPYEISGIVTPEQIKKLPQEFKSAAMATLAPDTYQVKLEGDLEFETGFLNKDEVEEIFRHLPIEITYADANDRVAFFSESVFRKGFVRTRTLIGRRFEYCHPPRLERFVRGVVDDLKAGKADFREY
ncbi:MAG: hemerythrin domain-containing protein, partial [Candidatus Bathyarchaeia archaeon]